MHIETSDESSSTYYYIIMCKTYVKREKLCFNYTSAVHKVEENNYEI